MVSTIAEKINKGIRLQKQDGLCLLGSADILAMAVLADAEKQKRVAQRVFFNVNCHINLTNICVARCDFCAFSCDKNDPGAYTLSAEDVVAKVRDALTTGITEVHMVSGLHPDLPFDFYLDVLSRLAQAFPEVHIKAFTPVEIQYFSEISGLSTQNVLLRLQAAGLRSLPGGGAEVLSERVRQQLCPSKASSAQWLQVMQEAHGLGLKSNATLLYGHIETHEEIIDHLLSVRELQDRTGGFQAFIPLPFHPANTKLAALKKPTALEILKLFAVSRLMLDNVDHIKAYWIMTGLKPAQLSLYFGVDDIDGTVTQEKITHAAGGRTAEGVAREQLIDLIKQADKIPVQRDTLYNVIEEYHEG